MHLRFDIAASGLPEDIRARLLALVRGVSSRPSGAFQRP
jgi:hypothetical protein